jgi:hypothetical protein
MVPRRDWLKAALFGGFAVAPRPTGADQTPSDRQAQDMIDALKEMKKAIETAHSFTEITEVRMRQVAFLKGEWKFPDFIEVGVDVWLGVHDWHVKHALPMVIGRDPNNRYTIMLLSTTLILRPDMLPTHIGNPYENRG